MNKTATKKSVKSDFRQLPKTYAALVAMLPPRPIHDDAELAGATDMIDRLAGFPLNADQEDYLEAISTFVEAYEVERFPLEQSRITPLAALKGLMAGHGMNASDLGRLLHNRTLGAAIVSGRRALSKTHIKLLADYFKVEPRLFL
jgi:antitoxin component HigA of HigAB toxin-antitoxin module